MNTSVASLRTRFFEYLFGAQRGITCIAYAPAARRQFKQSFFEWPTQKNNLEAFVEQISHGNNVWFCTSLLSQAQRRKEFALAGTLVWADLDNIEPDSIEPPPSCVVQSSPGHYHAYWRMDKSVIPKAQEEYSRKIAYKYGADKSGWDLTQLLRVPYTNNYKPEYGDEPPVVEILRATEEFVPLRILDEMFVPDEIYQKEIVTPIPMPDAMKLPKAEQILYRYISNITPDFRDLYETEPVEGTDWSAKLWRLINLCLEKDMELEEVFVIAQTAKCNKYERDNRPLSHLWRDILKASERQKRLSIVKESRAFTLSLPEIAEEGIRNSFVEEYKAWASSVTDAPEVYHELSAVILLSSVLSSSIKLDTSFGEIAPNLWGLILGGSTLTRKTTAMTMVKNIMLEIDPDAVVASQASPEGLLTALSLRPNRVSVFYRDEVSGFFESVRDKTYLSDLPELLTQLYDVPESISRLLRKDTYTVTKPYFIFFGGGIKNKVYSFVTESQITSGFMPRFIIVCGDTDAEHRRRTGPPIPGSYEKRAKIISELSDMRERYQTTTEIKLPNNSTQTLTTRVVAQLTDEAWERYGDIEYKMENAAEQSILPTVALPSYTRLCFSMLKMATLFAGARSEPSDSKTITVEIQDIDEAASYIQEWGMHTVDLLLNSGKGDVELKSDQALEFIRNHPGSYQTELYRRFHYRTKEGKEILETLLDRGLIYIMKKGKGVLLFPTVEGE